MHSCPTTTEVLVQSIRMVPVRRRTRPELTPFGTDGNPPARSSCRSALVFAPATLGPNASNPISRLPQRCAETSSRIARRPGICERGKINDYPPHLDCSPDSSERCPTAATGILMRFPLSSDTDRPLSRSAIDIPRPGGRHARSFSDLLSDLFRHLAAHHSVRRSARMSGELPASARDVDDDDFATASLNTAVAARYRREPSVRISSSSRRISAVSARACCQSERIPATAACKSRTCSRSSRTGSFVAALVGC